MIPNDLSRVAEWVEHTRLQRSLMMAEADPHAVEPYIRRFMDAEGWTPEELAYLVHVGLVRTLSYCGAIAYARDVTRAVARASVMAARMAEQGAEP